MSGVTQGQEESARSDLASANNRVLALVPETYQWMLLPSQSAPGEPVRIEEYKVTGSEAIAERCAKLLRKRDRLMPVMDGIALRLELDNIPLWNGDDIAVDTLCTYFARYVYLPRVGSRETILEAIRNGVAQPRVEPTDVCVGERQVRDGAYRNRRGRAAPESRRSRRIHREARGCPGPD